MACAVLQFFLVPLVDMAQRLGGSYLIWDFKNFFFFVKYGMWILPGCRL